MCVVNRKFSSHTRAPHSSKRLSRHIVYDLCYILYAMTISVFCYFVVLVLIFDKLSINLRAAKRISLHVCVKSRTTQHKYRVSNKILIFHDILSIKSNATYKRKAKRAQ